MSKQKEIELLRSLSTSDTALQKEDLSELITLLTPNDVKIYPRLKQIKARALTHEWNEASLAASGTWVSGVYADGDLPAETSHTHTRKSNKVMQIGRKAKATGLMNALDLTLNMNGEVVADAFALEFKEKLADLMRVMEYYILNGDVSNTSPQEADGLVNSIETNIVAASGANLTTTHVKTALKECYDRGGNPTAIYCRPGVAIQFADLNDNNLSHSINVGQAPTVIGGMATFKWLSPFGTLLEIVPVREDFLASGTVLFVEEGDVALAFLSDGIQVEDLGKTTDATEKFIKAYFTLEHRAERHSAKLTGVLDKY